MNGEIKHKKKTCNANQLFISGRGLQCGGCGAVNWENEMTPEQKKQYLEAIKNW